MLFFFPTPKATSLATFFTSLKQTMLLDFNIKDGISFFIIIIYFYTGFHRD